MAGTYSGGYHGTGDFEFTATTGADIARNHALLQRKAAENRARAAAASPGPKPKPKPKAKPRTKAAKPRLRPAPTSGPGALVAQTIYDFSPSAEELLNHLLPLTVKTALWQCVLDAVASEHIARMIAMKSATDAADKLIKKLTMDYNRARQGQITTELAEIMGGVEAMTQRK